MAPREALNLHGDPWALALVGLGLEQGVPGLSVFSTGSSGLAGLSVL